MKRRLIVLSCLLGLSACGEQPAGAKKADAERTIMVETTGARLSDASRTISRTGSLRAKREVKLSLQQEGMLLEGMLLELPFHEGDRVEQGALLARLDDTQLRAQLKKSEAQRRQAEQDVKRLERLRSGRVVAEDELARASTALDVARAEEEELNIRLQQSRLTAPFSGVISERLAEPGDTLPRFSHLLTLIDNSSLYTELQLSELVLPGLQAGDAVTLGIDALGPRRFNGSIARIHPVVDEASRQGTIEVRLSPPPAGALPGQLCRVTLQLRATARLMVPYNALRRDTRGEFLFIVRADNTIERRTVVSGLHFGEQVEILDGIEAGEQLVSRGFLGLGEGAHVTVANEQSAR
jgi:membrane fusion protein (multidrug efflux system)